jgi:hypothetical protein
MSTDTIFGIVIGTLLTIGFVFGWKAFVEYLEYKIESKLKKEKGDCKTSLLP